MGGRIIRPHRSPPYNIPRPATRDDPVTETELAKGDVPAPPVNPGEVALPLYKALSRPARNCNVYVAAYAILDQADYERHAQPYRWNAR